MSEAELVRRIRHANDLEELYKLLDSYVKVGRLRYGPEERSRIAEAAVEVFAASATPFPIAEVLSLFGDEIVPPMIAFAERPGGGEAKVLAGLQLLRRGERVGVPLLLQEIESNGDWRFGLARAFTDVGLRLHIPWLIESVRRHPIGPDNGIPTQEQSDLLSLIEMLEQTAADIPTDIRNKLTSPTAPVYVRTAAARLTRSSAND